MPLETRAFAAAPSSSGGARPNAKARRSRGLQEMSHAAPTQMLERAGRSGKDSHRKAANKARSSEGGTAASKLRCDYVAEHRSTPASSQGQLQGQPQGQLQAEKRKWEILLFRACSPASSGPALSCPCRPGSNRPLASALLPSLVPRIAAEVVARPHLGRASNAMDYLKGGSQE